MKTLMTLALGIFVITSAIAQEKTDKVNADGPQIVFTENTFDFGDIHQGDKVEHVFEFENAGNQPLIISNVLVTCGCTASDWPRDPIPPGESSSLTIKFNSAGKMGMQHKVVTIVSNAVEARAKVTIKTNVLPKQAGDTE